MLSVQYDWPLTTGPPATGTSADRPGSCPPEITYLWRIDIAAGKQPTAKYWGLLSESERSRALRFARDKDRTQFVLAHAALRQIVGSYHNIRPESIQFALGKYGKPHLACPDRPRQGQQKPIERPRSSEWHGASDLGGSSDPPVPLETLSGLGKLAPLEFSLAHSGDWALVALAARPIGVDVERVRPVDSLDAMIGRICTPQEGRHLRQMASEEGLEEFFRLWTAKEAVLKGAGLGLRINPDLVEIPACDDGLWMPVSLTHDDQHTQWHLQRFAVDEHHTAAIAVSETEMEMRVGTWVG